MSIKLVSTCRLLSQVLACNKHYINVSSSLYLLISSSRCHESVQGTKFHTICRTGRKVWEGDRAEDKSDTNFSCAYLSFCHKKILPRCPSSFTLAPIGEDGATWGCLAILGKGHWNGHGLESLCYPTWRPLAT